MLPPYNPKKYCDVSGNKTFLGGLNQEKGNIWRTLVYPGVNLVNDNRQEIKIGKKDDVPQQESTLNKQNYINHDGKCNLFWKGNVKKLSHRSVMIFQNMSVMMSCDCSNHTTSDDGLQSFLKLIPCPMWPQ